MYNNDDVIQYDMSLTKYVYRTSAVVSSGSGTYNIIVITYNIYNDVLKSISNLGISIINGWYYTEYAILKHITCPIEYNTRLSSS